MHAASRQQLITQSDYKNTLYSRYMQAPEHEVFHRVFHRQGANHSHKYPALQFKFSGMLYNMFTLIFAYLFCVLIRSQRESAKALREIESCPCEPIFRFQFPPATANVN